MARIESRKEFGVEMGDADHGRKESAPPKTSTPKAKSFTDHSIAMPVAGGSMFKGKATVNPLGARKGSPSGI